LIVFIGLRMNFKINRISYFDIFSLQFMLENLKIFMQNFFSLNERCRSRNLRNSCVCNLLSSDVRPVAYGQKRLQYLITRVVSSRRFFRRNRGAHI